MEVPTPWGCSMGCCRRRDRESDPGGLDNVYRGTFQYDHASFDVLILYCEFVIAGYKLAIP